MTPEFETYEDAKDWMLEQVGDDNCADNFRFAFDDDPEAQARYSEQESSGCCGSFDENVIVDGRPAVIGCNYGH